MSVNRQLPFNARIGSRVIEKELPKYKGYSMFLCNRMLGTTVRMTCRNFQLRYRILTISNSRKTFSSKVKTILLKAKKSYLT